MADEVDNANDHIERESVGMFQRALQPQGPTANGLCHWCGELVSDERRWCHGTDCRTLWDRYQAAGKRNGKSM